MNIQTQTISKIGQMPEALVREVNDYIDFLLWRDRHNQLRNLASLDSIEMVESDFSDYLSNLEEYETRLANGEIKWYQLNEET
jgi:Mn-containing catalase